MLSGTYPKYSERKCGADGVETFRSLDWMQDIKSTIRNIAEKVL